MSLKRLTSLDVFRGITVAFMVLVNSPGNKSSYDLLSHSQWNGCTIADLVFPLFIFIVGISSVYSISNAQEKYSKSVIVSSIIKRSIFLFIIGLLLNAFPYHFDFATIRIYGVLQRISICYLLGSILFLTTRIRTQVIITLLLLIGYAAIMLRFPLTPDDNFAAMMDRQVFSPSHLYGKTNDPEGLLSTIPALATVLLGNITGAWLLSSISKSQKLIGMSVAGIILCLLGLLSHQWFPINKALWSSSYVLWSTGVAAIGFSFFYWIIEIKALKKPFKWFEILGLNALLIYVLHIVFLKIQAMFSMRLNDGSIGSLRIYITEHLFPWVSENNASLLYALSYTILWIVLINVFNQKNHSSLRVDSK